jgi:hypothetical protein
MSGEFDDIIKQVMQSRGITPPQTGSGSLFDTDPSNAQGLQVPGNLNLHQRPVVHNSNGSISTVRSATVGNDQGQQVLIPTVIPGRGIVPIDQAQKYYEMTGQHLGIFDTPENADDYAVQLHNKQAGEYR